MNRYKHPVLFFVLSVVLPWTLWSVAAWLSHLPVQDGGTLLATTVLGIVGLISPMLIAGVLILRDPELRQDVRQRFAGWLKLRPIYVVLTLGLMLASILLAQAVSVLFGYSASQFQWAQSLSFESALLPAWLVLLMAPVVEELAWHTYGTDSLARKNNLFVVSLGFAVYWGLWHLPLSWINGYYHANLVLEGWIYGVNFLVSIIPFVILMNWLYFKTGRNILVAVVFHVTANLFNEVFATHPDSKVIQTGILLVMATIVVIKDRELFFGQGPRATVSA